MMGGYATITSPVKPKTAGPSLHAEGEAMCAMRGLEELQGRNIPYRTQINKAYELGKQSDVDGFDSLVEDSPLRIYHALGDAFRFGQQETTNFELAETFRKREPGTEPYHGNRQLSCP